MRVVEGTSEGRGTLCPVYGFASRLGAYPCSVEHPSFEAFVVALCLTETR